LVSWPRNGGSPKNHARCGRIVKAALTGGVSNIPPAHDQFGFVADSRANTGERLNGAWAGLIGQTTLYLVRGTTDRQADWCLEGKMKIRSSRGFLDRIVRGVWQIISFSW
jgi:hypothetical protein